MNNEYIFNVYGRCLTLIDHNWCKTYLDKVEGVKESDYDDVEVDDSSDELLMDDDDDEYNEITEAPQSSVLPAPNVSGMIFI